MKQGLKKLPIGIQTFRKIVEENCVYVDKTDIAFDLIQHYSYVFLSRPRRFGKSLFLDTLRNIFEGNKELFEGLYIYDKWDWSVRYPVVRISFNDGDFRSLEGFRQRIDEILAFNKRYLSVAYAERSQNSSGAFRRLIEETYSTYMQKVVVLVDEYDKPILDNIENPEVALVMREELKTFYSVIKGCDEYIKFVFLTGVSKFSKVSLFSGLNNLEDITLNPRFATIAGYRQVDLETSFADYLEGQDYAQIRRWYNGYRWLGEAVYNPFDILLFISNGYIFDNYWFSTGTPSFLLKLIDKNKYYIPNFENIVKNRSILDSFDIHSIDLETLMWQTGYLTITEARQTPAGMLYQLSIPNQEVQIALMGSIVDAIARPERGVQIRSLLYTALERGDMEELKAQIKALYASIPYHAFTKNPMHEKEGYYVSVFYAFMKGLGVDVRAEDVTNKGRIDLTVMLPSAIYIIEFKVNEGGALEQIKSKGYAEKYQGQGRVVYLVGIEFDTTMRNISRFAWERA